jgi:hypothetical protein
VSEPTTISPTSKIAHPTLTVARALSLIFGSSFLVFLSSYAYYVNDWACILVIPFVALAGLVLLVLFIFWGFKGLLCERILLFTPLAWLCAWMYLARPNGIWVWTHSRQAYASFVVPDSAKGIIRNGPRRRSGASYQIEFVSPESMDDLIAFYKNKTREAKLPLIGEQDSRKADHPLNRVHTAYYPFYCLSFQNRSGQKCVISISDNIPIKGLEHFRSVKLECHFDGAFLNPPVMAF